MKPTIRARRPDRGRGLGGLAVALVAAGLALAGCGTSSGLGSSGSGSSGSGGSTPVASHGSSPASGSGGGSGGPAFFPVTVGNTWVYRQSLGGTRTDRMTAVTPVSGGEAVTMSSTATGLGASTTKSTYIFRSDGSIELPSNELGSGVTISGGGLFWPPAAQLATGQPEKSTLHVRISQNGLHIKETAHILVRGAGTSSVTVPAGTYQATLVLTTMTVTADGIPVSIEIRTWVANGVGPVKSEAVLGEGGASHVSAVEELKSFTRG